MNRRSSKPVQSRTREQQPRRVQPRTQDPTHEKRAGSVLCSGCGVVYRSGRWSWASPSGDETTGLCVACQRLKDEEPAGIVRLSAGFGVGRQEVMGLVRNIEARESAEHPIERLMGVEEVDGELEIATTGLHLARCIASALKRRFHDHARIEYADERGLIRMDWRD